MKYLAPIIVTGVGAVLLILAGVLGWIVVPNIIDDKIVEEIRLVNGSDTWDKWAEIPIPIYLKFHIMHVTNPDEVETNWTKPIFVEKGPYAYRQTRVKTKIEQGPGETETLRFQETKTYFFDDTASCTGCSEDDLVNVVNVAFVSVVAGVAEMAGAQLAAMIASSVLGTETLIKRNVRVGDLTFNGFDVELYTTNLGPLLPEEFSGGRFGLYKGMNETADGEYEIFTGVGKTADFGKIIKWENRSSVPDEWWQPGTPCAMINGTDGSVFPPFVEKSRILDIFVTDLCRSIYLTFEKEIEYMGIKGYRFTAPREMLEDPRINVANQCFCKTHPDGTPDINLCPRAGLLPVGGCRSGAPIAMSTPHFLEGDEEYLADSGMTPPIKEQHETYIDLEPNTGLNLRASKKIQVNLELRKVGGVPQLSTMKKDYMIFPLIWANEEANLDKENADDVKKQLLTPLKIVNISKWSVMGVSLLIIAIGAALFFIHFRRSTQTL